MKAPELERQIGLEVYATSTEGVGGRIRQLLGDFSVREVLLDGSKAPLEPPRGPVGGRGSFLLCSLVKEGMDTLEAVRRLVKALGIPDGLISFAGLKDARAKTAQFLTVRGARPEILSQLGIRGLYVIPLCFRTEPLGPGELAANEFDITIRTIELARGAVLGRLDAVLSELAEFGGLPNFFGHQRFGTARPITHLVGRELVRGNVKKAVELFLTYAGPGEGPRTIEARSYLADTWDLKGFLSLLPRGLYYEHAMAKHLLEKPGDFHGALRLLPLRLRRLFVHAYQAYLFNRFLSKRIAYGLPLAEARPGDWLIELDERGLPTSRAIKVISTSKTGKGLVLALPLPGFRQELSSGAQGEVEKTILEEEGVRPEDFKVRVMPELASPGWLRPALVRPDMLRAPEVLDDGLNPGHRALRLCFRLPRGSYATVLLREIMKPEDVLKAGF